MSLSRRRLLTQNMNSMDEFILECTATPIYNSDIDSGFEFDIDINKNANLPIVSVQFNDVNEQVNAWDENISGENMSMQIEAVEGEKKIIRAVGAIKSFIPSQGNNANYTTKFKIVKWYSLSNSLFDSLFCYQTIDYNLIIPNSITNVNGEAFQIDSSPAITAYISTNSSLTLPSNVEEISSFGYFSTFFGNATNNGYVWSIDGIVLAVSCSYSTITEITIPNGTTRIAVNLLQKPLNFTKLAKINMPTDGLLTEIPKAFCSGLSALTEFECPASIQKISDLAFGYNSNDATTSAPPLASVKFYQPSGMQVSLPEAGSGSGMFYSKNAREMTVYTDNETIKNYDYASDNITATILHLDGSAWE